MKNIFIFYLSYIDIKMLCKYEFFFIKNVFSKNNALIVFIQDELTNELIL